MPKKGSIKQQPTRTFNVHCAFTERKRMREREREREKERKRDRESQNEKKILDRESKIWVGT